jgi:uncharacterized protein
VLVEAIARHARVDLPQKACLTILLHDAAEYVIGDMISPFKAVLGDAYKGVEARILAAVMLRFGLPAETPATIHRLTKEMDAVAAYHEATLLAGFAPAEAERFFGRPVSLPARIMSKLDPWTTERAEKTFKERFQALSVDDRG